MLEQNHKLDQGKRYKAYFAGVDEQQKKEFKNSRCIMGISVGQPYHESGKFIATTNLVDKHFSFCNILVGDTLQRHSLQIDHQDKSEEEIYALAKKAGDDWIERNMPTISTLTTPYIISRWDDWIQHEQFEYYHNRVYDLYNNYTAYKNTVDQIAFDFLQRRSKSDLKNPQIVFDLCIKYLLEESAVSCLWACTGYKFDVYPSGSNLAMIVARNKLVCNTIGSTTTVKLTIKKTHDSSINNIQSEEYKAEEYKDIATNFILAHAPGNIYWKDRNGIFLGCNVEHAKYFGVESPNDIIGKTNYDLLDEENAAYVTEVDEKVMTTGQEYVTEESDGTRFFLSKKIPLRDSNNNIVGIFGTSINITDQKNLKSDLERTVQELVEALKSKETFIKNMNHEIRIPMQLILSGSQILKENFYQFSDKEKLYFLDGMIKATSRLSDLVNNLLDMSKFKEGKFTLNLKMENLRSLFEEITQEFSLMYKNKIHCEIFLDDFTHIICDKIRIQQVLRNLLMNSIKYSKEATPIFIEVSSYNENETQYIKCSLKDEGIGIPEGEKDFIFEPFIVSSATRTIPGGIGLGLNISKEIIQSHSGKIWVDDILPGEVGARISFIIPIKH